MKIRFTVVWDENFFYTFAITLIYSFTNNNFGYEFVLFFTDFLFGDCKK
jgi:hypothetical protein